MKNVFSSHAQHGNCPITFSASPRLLRLLSRIPRSFLHTLKEQPCALYGIHVGHVGSRFVALTSPMLS